MFSVNFFHFPNIFLNRKDDPITVKTYNFGEEKKYIIFFNISQITIVFENVYNRWLQKISTIYL